METNKKKRKKQKCLDTRDKRNEVLGAETGFG